MDLNIARTRNLHSRKVAFVDEPLLVGRAAVLARLFSIEEQLLVLVGEPGIGKSRMLDELRRSEGKTNFRCVSVNCLKANASIPFEPLTSLSHGLRRRGRITDEQLRNFVDSRGPDRVWYFRELVAAAVSAGPLTLQIDDVQWADAESVEAMLCAVDRLQESAVQWQFAMRSGQSTLESRITALTSQGIAHVERLEPLSVDDTVKLARALVPSEARASLDPIKIWGDSRGNPLYIEYCAQAQALGRRATRGSRRRLFEQRIADVSEAATDISLWLAASDRPVAPATLAALTGLSVAGVTLLLEELEGAGLVEIIPDGPVFRHALIRDACYGLLDDVERRRRHSALVKYAENDWHRVLHLDGASLLTEAAATYNRLGWRHIDAAEPERALSAFDNALERVPADHAIAEEARSGHAIALMWLGRTADAMRAWQDFQVAHTARNDSLSVTAGVRLAEAAWENGEDVETALPVLRSALDHASEIAPHLLPRIYLLLGAIHERRDDLAAAQGYLELGLSAAESVANSRDALRLRSWLAVVKARLGDLSGGVAMLEAVVERADALRYVNDLAHACVKLCYLADMAGDYESYARWCHRGLRDQGPTSTHLRGLLMTNLASVQLYGGELVKALANAQAAEQLTSAAGGNLVGRAISQQAMIHAYMGRFDESLQCIDRAKRRRLTESFARAIEYVRGLVAEVQGDVETAREAYLNTLPATNGARLTEVFELRALVGVIRTTCDAGYLDDARSKLEQLRAACRTEWTISETLLAEAEGFVALAEGDMMAGCAHLDLAQRTGRHRLRQLILAATVAEAQKDRRTLTSSIATLEHLGAVGLAVALRKRARALGMRPGRSRLQPGVLTEREIDVAKFVAAGKSNGEIARLINVTRRTVEFHVANIFRKLDLTSSVELAAMLASGAVSGAEMIKR